MLGSFICLMMLLFLFLIIIVGILSFVCLLDIEFDVE